MSLHNVHLTTKSLHSPAVSAVLNLKVSITANITTATSEIQDIAGACSAVATGLVTLLYISQHLIFSSLKSTFICVLFTLSLIVNQIHPCTQSSVCLSDTVPLNSD